MYDFKKGFHQWPYRAEPKKRQKPNQPYPLKQFTSIPWTGIETSVNPVRSVFEIGRMYPLNEGITAVRLQYEVPLGCNRDQDREDSFAHSIWREAGLSAATRAQALNVIPKALAILDECSAPREMSCSHVAFEGPVYRFPRQRKNPDDTEISWSVVVGKREPKGRRLEIEIRNISLQIPGSMRPTFGADVVAHISMTFPDIDERSWKICTAPSLQRVENGEERDPLLAFAEDLVSAARRSSNRETSFPEVLCEDISAATADVCTKHVPSSIQVCCNVTIDRMRTEDDGLGSSVFSDIMWSTQTFAMQATEMGDDAGRAHRAFIALGSNVGDRVANIQRACALLESGGHSKVARTSGLWETEPMYVADQDKFLNGACEIETNLEPLELLDRLQEIENTLGRVKTVDKGPRSIDLDILLFDRQTVSVDRLEVPHKLMLEREFVLRPLCEIAPNETLPGAKLSTPISAHLEALAPGASSLSTIVPLSNTAPPLVPLQPSRQTRIMSILNLTPDSFSDGGMHTLSNASSSAAYAPDPKALTPTILAHIAAGASIIDIGGQSTRPRAELLPPDVELARILPTIKHIRTLPEARDTTLSIDTFHSGVARAAIQAGADVINDVSGGTMDPNMLPTIAELGCTFVLMHMRGTPATMSTLTDYSSYPGGVLEGVARELLARVDAAEKAGIRRWRIVLDPGIGFAKTQAQNLELLRRFSELRDWDGLRGLPWLVGASRKGFIGSITGVKEAGKRVFGTAACVTAAVHGGADVVRVHDVAEMGQLVKMADAIYRA